MNNERIFVELDQRRTEEISGGVIIPPPVINPGIRIALWIARKLKR